MTNLEAKEIIMQAAIRDIGGSGRGIRSTSDEWRKKVITAIVKLWPEIYGHEITEGEKFNNGLRV